MTKRSPRLPDAFVERLYAAFPPARAEQILAGMRRPRPVTLRVNALKTDVRSLMAHLRQARIKVDRVAWHPEALVVKDARERDLAALPGYEQGLFYLQSLSSMLPPLVLAPQPGERVLDLAAAPGSKTTQMAAMMDNRGYILANDANPVRAERLRFNLSRQGVTIAEVSVHDGRRVGGRLGPVFDRVLLDAPCSGEGRFVEGDPRTHRHWSEKLVRRMVALQRRLLASALRATRPGGVVVYATCTLNPDENEGVVDWALKRYGEALEVLPVALDVPGRWEGLTEVGGVSLHPSLRLAVRIPPSPTMEGFFVCKLRVREGGEPWQASSRPST
ncbi:RsmB/NOP family class I SAM-dependent RNA methyltransferase [Geochorda subterranea]|uniref:RsmB/NOP family class I SAM-dependent RNA methyltransferase n=1 Tax=Geochorda subterranea TaxID=3109564 RepID=A0ABZ1BQF8_9FIRM|nr:RsmB/NOP family class I SAM-dependent RNA methyltransferase [Limnochorda sp. LNt]WRP14347.1 RsmB/NOP family class I SAM-dependent RNA methyltransferase [Limnochorda sp. LNt]